MIRLKTIRNIFLICVGLLAIAETGVRLSGLTDFPVYTVSNDIGYIPQANQTGTFLNKNSWVFNDRSMGVESNWSPTAKSNIIVIGNSIVMGGNPYDQKDKIGPLLQVGIGDRYAVWPIAAGGWTNVNETAYLEKNPDVVKAANFFIWEYMSGGLSQLSQWRGDYVFPKTKPTLATWYVFRRYVLPRFMKLNMNELPPTGALNADNLQKFESSISELAAATGKKIPGLLFFYPTKEQFLATKTGVEYLPERQELERISAKYGVVVVDVARRPEWNESLYREGTHPTVEGNVVLTRILTKTVTDVLNRP